MPVRDYKAYAATPHGKAARQRARAAYIQRRRELGAQPESLRINPKPLAQAVANWRT